MIKEITLKDFRNHAFFNQKIETNCVILSGENGVGKTSIVEAISIFMPGRGLRATNFDEIVRDHSAQENQIRETDYSNLAGHTKPWAVKLTINNTNQDICDNNDVDEYQIKCTYCAIKKKKVISSNITGDKAKTQKRHFPHIMWITPEMEGLFFSLSTEKRQIFSRMVHGIYPEYTKEYAAYNYYSKSRIKILIEQSQLNNPNSILLNVVENKLAFLSVTMGIKRIKLVELLNSIFTDETKRDKNTILKIEINGNMEDFLYQSPDLNQKLLDIVDNISFKDQLVYSDNETKNQHAKYINTLVETLQKILLQNRQIDQIKQQMSFNAAKFNISLFHTNEMIDYKCSTGEQKLLLVNLIGAYIEAFQKTRKNKGVVLLLDDFFSHLDESRKYFLLNYVYLPNVQIWITTTDHSLHNMISSLTQKVDSIML